MVNQNEDELRFDNNLQNMEAYNRNSTKIQRLDTEFDNSRRGTDTNIIRKDTFEESDVSNMREEEELKKEYEEYSRKQEEEERLKQESKRLEQEEERMRQESKRLEQEE